MMASEGEVMMVIESNLDACFGSHLFVCTLLSSHTPSFTE